MHYFARLFTCTTGLFITLLCIEDAQAEALMMGTSDGPCYMSKLQNLGLISILPRHFLSMPQKASMYLSLISSITPESLLEDTIKNKQYQLVRLLLCCEISRAYGLVWR